MKSCFNCKEFRLCYVRRGMDDFLRSCGGNLNIDNPKYEKGYKDFFTTLAESCFDYKESQEK